MHQSISIFAISIVGATAPERWMDLTDMEREASIRQLASEPLPGRLLQASEKFLGTPYASSPLGEGRGKDADPLIRFDAVDCLTFVEETLAISFANEPREVEPILIDLRYAKEVAFDDRNHLMEAQWLPHNLGKGFLRDVTRRYGGDSTEVVHKTLSPTTWTSRSSRALGLSPNREPLGTFELPIIPIERVRAAAKRIPSGTLLVVVREDRPYKPTRISHVGFVLHRGQNTFLRHATLRAAKVVDEELSSFLLRNLKYEKWKVVGVSLYEAIPPRSKSASKLAR
jgi:hypothetical protein